MRAKNGHSNSAEAHPLTSMSFSGGGAPAHRARRHKSVGVLRRRCSEKSRPVREQMLHGAARFLGQALGLERLWIKDESLNPGGKSNKPRFRSSPIYRRREASDTIDVMSIRKCSDPPPERPCGQAGTTTARSLTRRRGREHSGALFTGSRLRAARACDARVQGGAESRGMLGMIASRVHQNRAVVNVPNGWLPDRNSPGQGPRAGFWASRLPSRPSCGLQGDVQSRFGLDS